jgi:YHS domain-containing protein
MEGVFSLLLFAALFYFMMRFGCGAHMGRGHGGHRRGDHAGRGGLPPVGESSVDPVCGMPVEPEKGYAKVQDGRAYRFCSRACLDKFEAGPQKYAA